MRIGVTYTGSPEKHNNYVRWLMSGEDIEVIRLSVEDNNLDAAGDCDGLVLSGGVDIHPSFYGGGMEYPEMPAVWRKDRDEFENAVLGLALELGKPVLGVCRGLQLINVRFGGTLVQDLGVRGDEVHQNTGTADKRHEVKVEKDSMLYSISGVGGEANSAHHQAIDRLGDNLRVNCRGEDGVIEGIEWAEPAGKSFLLAVQWHPERMYTNGFRDAALYKNIKDRFMEAIK